MRALTLLLGLVLCGNLTAEHGKVAPVVMMEEALRDMLARPADKEPFVIFTDKKTKHFVQYSYDEDGLYMDIPLIDRSKEEVERLARVFGSIGVERPVANTARDVKTKKPFVIRAYQAGFAKDASKAARFGIRVFREAYLLKQLSITIETE